MKTIKNVPTIFPSGFGLRRTADDIIIIDLIDTAEYDEDSEKERNVTVSFALTIERANDMIEKLKTIVGVEGIKNDSDK
ncbi:MAG: hypothetical protein ACP5FK_11585 [bacterium]